MTASAGAAVAPPVLDPVSSAKAAGLRYTTDTRPGIRRHRRGRSFAYTDADGRAIRSRPDLARIAALVIPPAWTGVWICPDPRGHLQATGRDARGRKQYRYHSKWRAHGSVAYFRIQGPTVLIEYAPQQGDLNHIHTIYRDPTNDYGARFLKP